MPKTDLLGLSDRIFPEQYGANLGLSYIASVCTRIAEAVHARDDQRRDWIEDSLYRTSSNCYLYTALAVHDNEIVLCSLGPSLGR